EHRHPGHAGAAFGAAAGAAAFVAGLLVELATTHFLLDAAVFDQFPKSSHGFLDRFPFAQTQLDHEFLRLSSMRKDSPTVGRPGGFPPQNPIRKGPESGSHAATCGSCS